MGKSCSCLRSYQSEHNIHLSKSRPSNHSNAKNQPYSPPPCILRPSPINIHSPPIHINKANNNYYLRYTQHAHNTNDAYHRVDTLSSVHDDDTASIHDRTPYFHTEPLRLHRMITVGYITHQLSQYTTIDAQHPLSLPSCVIELCLKYYFALQPIRRKRVVFTSIVQLNLCIDEIPPFILNESIFFFKANKNELIDAINMISHTDTVHVDAADPDRAHTTDGSFFSNLTRCTQSISSTHSFIKDLQPLLIQYLAKKYEEKLLLIMDEENDWNAISQQLGSIEDIWRRDIDTADEAHTYHPLRLKDTFWIHNNAAPVHLKYEVDCVDVMDEIAYNELKYAPTMEILWQSNPSLIPMRNFDMNQYHTENGYNAEYIGCNNAANTYDIKSSKEFADDHESEMITTPSNADLVVLSMYNSGNDFSEISKTSYCDELSYTAHAYVAQAYYPFVNDVRNIVAADPDLYDANVPHLHHYVVPNAAMHRPYDHGTGAIVSSSSSSGCNLCQNYHKYVY